MPIKDPERKREVMKRWRDSAIANGYGKWLYGRRKLRFQDAEVFREALEQIVEITNDPDMAQEAKVEAANFHARAALQDSAHREAELGLWESPTRKEE